MSPKVRKISYKIYLSAQALIILVGSGVLVWNLVAGAHDLFISSKGKECSIQVIGNGVIESHSENNSVRWTDAIENYSKSFDHPAKLYAL